MRESAEEIPTVHGRLDFAAGQLRRLRELVSVAARRAGLDKWRQQRLVLAVNEAAINAIEHGGGMVTWTSSRTIKRCSWHR